MMIWGSNVEESRGSPVRIGNIYDQDNAPDRLDVSAALPLCRTFYSCQVV
jgi:hypothetical protein